MMRRLGFVMALRIDLFPAKFGIILLINTLQIIYTTTYLPYVDMSTNIQELVNEYIFLLILYLLPLYTDFVPSSIQRYNIGWVGCALLGVLLLVNVIISFQTIIKGYCARKLKQKIARNKRIVKM